MMPSAGWPKITRLMGAPPLQIFQRLLSGGRNMEHTLSVAVVELFALRGGNWSGIHECNGWGRRLIRIVDGPENVVDSERFDGVVEREVRFRAAGGDDEIAFEILAGLELEFG